MLKPALPAAASLSNPVDVIGDAHADRYEVAVHHVMKDPGVDMGIVILTPQSTTEPKETGEVIPLAIKGIDKPVVCSFMGARDVAPGVHALRDAGVPTYTIPEDGIKSLAAAHVLVTTQELDDRETPVFNDVDVTGAKKIISDLL